MKGKTFERTFLPLYPSNCMGNICKVAFKFHITELKQPQINHGFKGLGVNSHFIPFLCIPREISFEFSLYVSQRSSKIGCRLKLVPSDSLGT